MEGGTQGWDRGERGGGVEAVENEGGEVDDGVPGGGVDEFDEDGDDDDTTIMTKAMATAVWMMTRWRL